MEMLSGNSANMVFKPVIRSGFGQLYLDGRMLTVLMILDGKKTVMQVAKETGIPFATVRQILSKLLYLRLIEGVERAVSIVDQEFIDYLVYRMSLAIGPLGEIVVDDGLADLGFSRNNLPYLRTAELVNHLSHQIVREERRAEFKFEMLRKIREKGMLS